MNKLVLLLLIIATKNSIAATDYQCVSRCTSAGYQYGLCVEKCSWDEAPVYQQQQSDQLQKIKQTDFQCVNNCTSNGNQYGFCVDRCSY